MEMSVLPISSFGVDHGSLAGAGVDDAAGSSSFLDTIHAALASVSAAQGAAAASESAVAAGTPGASQATALVLSDRAELGWTGVVAVRNEIVSAYQTLSNMQI
ncbi:flagellar hook-basal body complex protein FliE [Thioclava sp. BHET1]|nr:flagellar hook-basal body complex protein FliE [Thioclava sp. BHET1]